MLFAKKMPEYILSFEDKVKKIKALGVDYLYILTFDDKFSKLSPEQYFDFILKMTSPKIITTGFNHFFGNNKLGDTNYLAKMCQNNNIAYKKIMPVKFDNHIVSSSVIRKSLKSADFKTASLLLNYDFYVKGKVTKGQKIASEFGFKTINTEYPKNIIKIPFGVYCTKVQIDNKTYESITNWGQKPTVNYNGNPLIETHILDFNENAYDKNVKIMFYSKVRDEKKFDTIEDLKKQISKDVEFCKNYFKTH